MAETESDSLDKLFSPSCWSKRPLSSDEIVKNHLEFLENKNQYVDATIEAHLNISYGPREKEKLDIYGTDLPDDAPIFVFIHGGYWQEQVLNRKSYRFIAKTMYDKRIKTIFIGYDLCPDVTLPEIIKQIERAAQKCIKYATDRNSKGLYFCGHSAGAHLVASLFTNSVHIADRDSIRGAILIGGIFDLSQLRLTKYNDALKLDEEQATKMSPLNQDISAGENTQFCVVVGKDDSPEFVEQAKKMGRKIALHPINTIFSLFDNVDHFDIVERLAQEDFTLTQVIFEIIGAYPSESH